jgi:hypothetical protein
VAAQALPPKELGGVNSSRPTTMSTELGGSTSWGTRPILPDGADATPVRRTGAVD